jgi:hypothetical protein
MFSSLLRFLPVLLFCIPLLTVLGLAAGMKEMMSWRWRSSLCFFVPAPSLFSRGLLLRCTAGGEGTAEKKMVAAAVGFGGDDEVGLGKLLDRGMEEMMRALAVLAEKAASGARKQWSREGDGQGRDWFWVFSLSRLKTELSAFPPKRTPPSGSC